ncbi:MAG TPA: hypothetical protein VMI75_32605 [Polyangiaceae bacterium]|nr:hypothetical protein [Polyangiaceae bacterium]
MTTRAHAAALVLCLLSAASACATSTEAGGGYAGDASTESQERPDTSGGPSPDAIVLGDDGPAPAEEAGEDAGDDAPIVAKSCTGLSDGTPCAPAPDICHDAAVCMGGTCAPPAAKADGFVCGKAPDVCHLAPVCKSGACAAAANAQDGTQCGNAPNACHDAPKCSAGKCAAAAEKANGFQWSASDATSMCCGGTEAHSSDDNNCGVCGIQCNASNGESCSALGGHYFCRGCVASAACWSHCCSTSFSPYSCAASDCAGNCSAQYCPAGTHCVSGGGTSSDYCSY